MIKYSLSFIGVILLTGLHHLSLPADEGLHFSVPGLPPVSLLPDLSYLAPNCFHPSQKLHSKSKNYSLNNFKRRYNATYCFSC